MKVEKLRKYLKADEMTLYAMLERQLKALGYCPVVKYEQKTYRYKKDNGKNRNSKVSKLPKDVVVYQDPQYIYAEGDLPVLLVAHTDIAHTREPLQIFFDQEAGVMWSPDGLGADDRAGVFAVMELAARFNVGVLLCSGEESGGIGVQEFCHDFRENNGYRIAIELDRCGIDDCVFYDNDNKKFHDWVEGFGFSTSWGSFSDISILGPSWRINTVNLSVGYEEEHTSQEHLYIRELYRTIEKVSNILSQEIPHFQYEEKTWTRAYSGSSRSGRPSWFYDDVGSRDYKDYCDFCGLYAELSIVEGTYLCQKCFDNNAFDCLACGVAAYNDFDVVDAKEEGLCHECVNRYFVTEASKESDKDKRDAVAKKSEAGGCAG